MEAADHDGVPAATETMPEPAPRHPACLPDAALLREVVVRRHRASGPGGQRRNKVETAVQLEHRPTGLTASASERRSLEANRHEALDRLRRKLALEHRVAVDAETFRPSELWRRRTAGTRLDVNPGHADVPPLLAEALDVLAAVDDEAAAAGELLGVSASRVLRVLRLEPAALAGVNERRKGSGRRGYR